jgi:hypothetical protein
VTSAENDGRRRWLTRKSVAWITAGALAASLVGVALARRSTGNDSAASGAAASRAASSRAAASRAAPSHQPTAPAAPTRSDPPSTAKAAGVQPGVDLRTHRGDEVVKTSGVVLSNLHITGDLTIDGPAANVTVSNVEVDGSVQINANTPSVAQGGGRVAATPKNIVLRHVDAHGLSAVGFEGLTVDASRFHDAAGTLSQLSRYRTASLDWPATNLTITNSVFEHLHAVPAGSGYHLEDLHLMGVQGFTLSGDIFDATAPNQATWTQITAALTLEQGFEGVPNSGTISGCSFIGGSYYQGYLWGITSATGNRFTTATSPDGAHTSSPMYPPSAYGQSFPAFTQSGNTLDGQPYTLPTR